MQKGVPALFAFSLAFYWLTYLRGARTSQFADSTRYLDPASGWSLVAALDRHQGAFFPVALFHAAGTPAGVFIVNSVAWLLSWTLLCAAVARRLTAQAAFAVSAALLVVSTTSQVVGWHGAVLTESLAVSVAVMTIAAIVFESARARTPWGSVGSAVNRRRLSCERFRLHYLGITFVLLVACSVRGRPAFWIACVPLLAGVIAVAAVAMFVDAIEQGRHASSFNVLSLTTAVLMLPAASSLREN